MNTKKQPVKKAKAVVAKKVTKAKVKVEKPKAKSKTVASRKVLVKTVTKTKKKVVRKPATMAAEKKVNTAKKTLARKESALKKMTYKFLSLILGLLIATFVYLFVEFAYLKKALENGLSLQSHTYFGICSYVPAPLEILILLIGFIFGIWLGNWGWDYVYVQQRHRSIRKA